MYKYKFKHEYHIIRTQFQFSFAAGFLLSLAFTCKCIHKQKPPYSNMGSNCILKFDEIRDLCVLNTHAFSIESLPIQNVYVAWQMYVLPVYLCVFIHIKCEYECCRRLPNNKCIALHGVSYFCILVIFHQQHQHHHVHISSNWILQLFFFIKRKRKTLQIE